MMNFLYPGFLAALSVIAIPIILHFLNLQRTRKVKFTYFNFLAKVSESSRSRLKLKHLLILCARILFLVFLVLAFSQPIIPPPIQDENKLSSESHILILFDNSQSMTVGNEENITAFEKSLAFAESLLDQLPEYATISFETIDLSVVAHRQKDKNNIKSKLSAVSPSYQSFEFERTKERMAYHRSEGVDAVYLISDWQKNSIDVEKLQLSDTVSTISLVETGGVRVTNVAVDSVWFKQPIITYGQTNSLQVRLKNYGQDEVKSMRVSLLVQGVQIAQLACDIAANDSRNIVFDVMIKDTIELAASIEIDDMPANFDNKYYFTYKPISTVDVHVLCQDTLKSSVYNVYSKNSLFKLSASLKSNPDVGKLLQADFVVIDDVAIPSQGVTDVIRRRIEQGKHVLFIPSVSSQTKEISDFLSDLGITSYSVEKHDTTSKESVRLAVPDINHPLFDQVFDDFNPKMEMPSVQPVFVFSGGKKALSFLNNIPYLTQYNAKKALFTTLSTPLNKSLSGFQRHALFVPVMYRLAMMSKGIDKPLAYRLNDAYVLINRIEGKSKSVFTLTAEGRKYIPSQQITDEGLLLGLSQIELVPGVYEVEQDSLVYTKVAFNASRKESELTYFNKDELTQLFSAYPNVSVSALSDYSSIEKYFENRSHGYALWKYCLVLSLLFLLCEILLIRWWK